MTSTLIGYETRTTRIVVLRKGAEIFDESATTIEIVDESGGEFLTISQSHTDAHSSLKIDPQEWPHIRAAIDRLAAECRA